MQQVLKTEKGKKITHNLSPRNNYLMSPLHSFLCVLSFFVVFFWLCHLACGILVPQPGTEPVTPALEVWSLNHWTAREVPCFVFFLIYRFRR